MSRLQIIIVVLAGLRCLAGCGPTLTVKNSTRIPVRAFIAAKDGNSSLSPSPGESSSAEVSEGAFAASAYPDAEWVNYARTTRKVLNDQLADAGKLSGPQLLDMIQRLKDIAARMQEFGKAAGVGASSAGTVSSDHDASVTVSLGTDGKLVVSCR